jgi:hypothetical protein
MANPNMLALTTISGTKSSVAPSNTSANSIISNAAASGTIVKVNSLVVANTDTVARNCTINVYSAAALAGTAFALCSVTSIPANSTLVVISKDTAIYLTEDSSLGITAGTANTLVANASYEICS